MAHHTIGGPTETFEFGLKTPAGGSDPVADGRSAGVGQPSHECQARCQARCQAPILAPLLSEAVAAAREGLDALDRDARLVARSFRDGRTTTANQELAIFVDAVRSLTVLTATLGDAAQIDLDTLAWGTSTAPRALADVTGAIERLVDAHVHHAWPSVADALEFDVIPALGEWPSLLDAFSERCAA